LDKPGSVKVADVHASGGDVTVSGFALRPNPFLTGGQMIGSMTGTLAHAGLTPGPAAVTQVCDPAAGAVDELVVQLHNDGITAARSDGLTVTYDADGQTHVLQIPHGFVQCAKPIEDPECETPNPPQ
jgi:hypothetical protein